LMEVEKDSEGPELGVLRPALAAELVAVEMVLVAAAMVVVVAVTVMPVMVVM